MEQEILLGKIFRLIDEQYETDKEFAKAIGVPAQRVSEWRLGKSKSYQKYLFQIAGALGVEASDIVTNQIAEAGSKKTQESKNESEISESDARLLQWFRSLDPKKQKAILAAHDAPEDVE